MTSQFESINCGEEKGGIAEVDMSDDERMMRELIEALHYCTTEFLPEPEVLQSACHYGS